jgi:hypothetical protein
MSWFEFAEVDALTSFCGSLDDLRRLRWSLESSVTPSALRSLELAVRHFVHEILIILVEDDLHESAFRPWCSPHEKSETILRVDIGCENFGELKLTLSSVIRN